MFPLRAKVLLINTNEMMTVVIVIIHYLYVTVINTVHSSVCR